MGKLADLIRVAIKFTFQKTLNALNGILHARIFIGGMWAVMGQCFQIFFIFSSGREYQTFAIKQKVAPLGNILEHNGHQYHDGESLLAVYQVYMSITLDGCQHSQVVGIMLFLESVRLKVLL